MTRFNAPTVLAAMTAAVFISSPAAHAEMIKYSATLAGAAQVPPVDSTATGTAEITVDTDAKTVTWVFTADGLSGAATAAHIHGPASATETAPPVIDVMVDPMTGSAEITEAQAADMAAGMTYFNVHTEKFPDGEIRGQIEVAK